MSDRPMAHRTDPHLVNTVIYSQRKIRGLLQSLDYYKKNRNDAQDEIDFRAKEALTKAHATPNEPGWYWCNDKNPRYWDGTQWFDSYTAVPGCKFKVTVGPDGNPLRVINPSKDYK